MDEWIIIGSIIVLAILGLLIVRDLSDDEKENQDEANNYNITSDILYFVINIFWLYAM